MITRAVCVTGIEYVSTYFDTYFMGEFFTLIPLES